MDLFDLLILSLFALPALLRWIEQSRKGERQGDSAPSTESPAGDSLRGEFERALEEIGLTLQGKPVPDSAPKRDGPHASRGSQKALESERAFSREEQFERRSRPHGSGGAIPFRELKKVEIASPYSRRRSTMSRKTRLIKRRLGNRAATRNAILLSEILGPPVAMRHGRR